MGRIRSNFVSGVIDNNPLAIGGLTLNATELADLAVVASPDIAAIILDPTGGAGDPEIVHVTAHSGSATTATIVRAREGTVAREHLLSVSWVHGPTKQDLTPPREFFVLPQLPNGGTAIWAQPDGSQLLGLTIGPGAETCFFIFVIPQDFNLLDSAEIWISPDITTTIDYSLASSYSAIGEAQSTHTETEDNTNLAVTDLIPIALDVSGVLSSIAIGDLVGIRLSAVTDNAIIAIGLRIKYN